ncbi:hypothetical protein [Nocardia salmonicida]|nr:hypothetical protein [Nocardia salmonicida]
MSDFDEPQLPQREAQEVPPPHDGWEFSADAVLLTAVLEGLRTVIDAA